MVPQGWKGEFGGWMAADAWSNAIATARQAEALGFESLWVFDHFTTVPEPTDEITFESFTMLAVCPAGPSLTPAHEPTEFSGLAERWMEMPVRAATGAAAASPCGSPATTYAGARIPAPSGRWRRPDSRREHRSPGLFSRSSGGPRTTLRPRSRRDRRRYAPAR